MTPLHLDHIPTFLLSFLLGLPLPSGWMQRDYLDFTRANESLSGSEELPRSARFSAPDGLEAATIIEFCTRTAFCTSCPGNINEQQNEIIWKAFEYGDAQTKLAVAHVCSPHCTTQESNAMIQTFKTIMMQSSCLITLQTVHVTSRKMLPFVDAQQKEQFLYIMSVIERRWHTLCQSHAFGSLNAFGLACPTSHTTTPRVEIEKRELWDSLRTRAQRQELLEWFTAVCEYCEWDATSDTAQCADLTSVLRATVIYMTSKLRSVDSCEAGWITSQAEVVLTVGHNIAAAVSAHQARNGHEEPFRSSLQIFAIELNSQLRVRSYGTATVLLALQLAICGGFVAKTGSEPRGYHASSVFEYMCLATTKLLYISAYQEAVHIKCALQDPLDLSHKASLDLTKEEIVHGDTPSEYQTLFARHCWVSTYDMLTSLEEATLLGMCLWQIDQQMSNASLPPADGSSVRKQPVLVLTEEHLIRGWRTLQAPRTVQLWTMLQLPSALAAESLLPLCLIADTMAQALRSDLQAQRSSLPHLTDSVASKFVHSLSILHAVRISALAPRLALCLLFDAICDVLTDYCANIATEDAPLAIIVQALVAFLSTASRLLRITPTEVLRTVLPRFANNVGQCSDPAPLTEYTTLRARISLHCSSLLGSAVFAHYLCATEELGESKQVLQWAVELFKTEPLQVLLLVNDQPYLCEYLTRYSESVVRVAVNALLDSLICCRSSTNPSCSIVQKTLRVFRKNLVEYMAARRQHRPAEGTEFSTCKIASACLSAAAPVAVCCEDIEQLESAILQGYQDRGTTALLQLLQSRTDPSEHCVVGPSRLCRLQVLNRLSVLSAPAFAPLAQSARSYLQSSNDLFQALFNGIGDGGNDDGSAFTEANRRCLLITPLECACCARKQGIYPTIQAAVSAARLEAVLAQYLRTGDHQGFEDRHALPWHNLDDLTYVVIHAVSSSVRVVRQEPESVLPNNSYCRYLPDRKIMQVVRAHAHFLVLPALADSLRVCLLKLGDDLSPRTDTLLCYVHAILDIIEQCEIPPAQMLQVIGFTASQHACTQLLRLHLTTAPSWVLWMGDILCRATSVVLSAMKASTMKGERHSPSATQAFALTAPLWALTSSVGDWIEEQVGLSAAIVALGEQLCANCAALISAVVEDLAHDANDTVEVSVIVPLCMIDLTVDIQNPASPFDVYVVHHGDVVSVCRQLAYDNNAASCTVRVAVNKLTATQMRPVGRLSGVFVSFSHAVDVILAVNTAQDKQPYFPAVVSDSENEYNTHLQRVQQRVRVLAEEGLQMEDIRMRDFLVQSWKVDPQCTNIPLRPCVMNALLAADPPQWHLTTAFGTIIVDTTTRSVTVLLFLLRESEAIHGTNVTVASPLAGLNKVLSVLVEQLDGLRAGDKQAHRRWVVGARQRLRWISLVMQATDYRQIVEKLLRFMSSEPFTTRQTRDETTGDGVCVLDAAADHLNSMLTLLKLFRSCKESVPCHMRKLVMLVLGVTIKHVLSEISSTASNSIDTNKHPTLKTCVKGVLAHLLQPSSAQTVSQDGSSIGVEMTLLCAQHFLDARPVCKFFDRTISASETLRLLQYQRHILPSASPPASTPAKLELKTEHSKDTGKFLPQTGGEKSEKSGAKQSSAKRNKDRQRCDNDNSLDDVGELEQKEPRAKKSLMSDITLLATTPSRRDNQMNVTGNTGAAGLEFDYKGARRSAADISTPGSAFVANHSTPEPWPSRSQNSFLSALQGVPIATAATEFHAHKDPAGGTTMSSASPQPDTAPAPHITEYIAPRPVFVKTEEAAVEFTAPMQRSALDAPLASLNASSPATNGHSVVHTPGSKGVASIAISKKFGTGF